MTRSHVGDQTKNIFLRFFTELKTYYLPHSIYKHDTIDSADPSVADPSCFAIFLSSLLIKILLIQVTLETTAEDQLNNKNRNPSNAFLG